MKNTKDDAYVTHVLCITFALRQNLFHFELLPINSWTLNAFEKEKTENHLEMKLKFPTLPTTLH
jgi:hypothetical protein